MRNMIWMTVVILLGACSGLRGMETSGAEGKLVCEDLFIYEICAQDYTSGGIGYCGASVAVCKAYDDTYTSTAAEQTIQDTYIAYYGRPADPGGLSYWAGRLDDANGNLNEVIDAFGTSVEFTDRFASQLDDDPTHTSIDRLVDVGRKSQDALYLPWAGELVIEGVHDARLSPDGSEFDIDRYRIVDLPAGSYDIELAVDGDGRELSMFIFSHRHPDKLHSENDLRIGYAPKYVDGPNFHQRLQFEDDAILTIQVGGASDESLYTLSVTPSEIEYPVFDPDWQPSPNADPEFWSGFYDYLFI